MFVPAMLTQARMSDNSKLDGLQVARAVAALGIAYFHSWHVTMPFPADTAYPIPILMEYGWAAVDFFFAISGFVICMVVTSPNFRPVSFLLRRAFRLYPLWIAASFVYLSLTDYIGRSERQTDAFFNWSLTLLPTNGMPFYDIGWSLQHEMLFYVLAAVVTPWFGIYGVAAVLALGVAADHATELPWYLHQYFFYYGNFLAGIAAFLVHRSGLRLGFILPLVLGFVAFHWAPTRSLFPIALFCWLVGFVNLNIIWRIGRLGALLGDASYSIYLLHPLVFYWIYIQLQPPLPPVWMQEPLRYGAMIAVCGAAITSWMLFERPMIYLGGRVDRYFRSRRSTTVLADQTSG
jgi:peptidoglycan/LPS O-acetylase OafA/YrhL